MKPNILILDMDGTIIGNSSFQTAEYEIHNALKVKQNPKSISYALLNGLLRPHVESFLKYCNSEGYEMYIYTAAEHKWASYILAAIEKTLKIKFNRPFFTRNHCDVNSSTSKSLKSISKKIYQKLKTKYDLKSPNEIDDRILFIDNSDVLCRHEKQKWLVCPTFNSIVPTDVLKHIDTEHVYRKLKTIKNILAIYKFVEQDKLHDNILPTYYNFLAQCIKQTTFQSYQQAVLADDFFYKLEVFLRNHKINTFNEKVVAYMNTKLSK